MPKEVPTYTEFIVAYPIFGTDVEELNVQRQLDIAARLLSKSSWGDWYSDAILLLTAHELLLWLKSQQSIEGGMKTASGNVASVSGAGLSISYNAVDTVSTSRSDIWYSKTGYGQQFLLLRSQVIPNACLSF